MTDKWDFYFKNIDGKPASLFVNLGIRATTPDKSLPHLVWAWVDMNDPQPNGFSCAAEAPALGALEDTIVPSVRTFAAFIGRITTDGRREFYFHSADPERCRQAISAGMSAHPGYRYEFGHQQDPGWSHYLELLYPGPEDMLRIRNRHVVDALKKQGDDLTVARQVDHWAHFASPENRGAFVVEATQKGYTVHAELAPTSESKPFPYGVIVKRVDLPSKIDGVTIELFRLAKANQGIYGDWGTAHVK